MKNLRDRKKKKKPKKKKKRKKKNLLSFQGPSPLVCPISPSCLVLPVMYYDLGHARQLKVPQRLCRQ
jgi:hypothetical protein